MKSCRSEVPSNKSSFAVKALSCLPNFSITLAVILKSLHTSYTHVNTWNKMHNKQQNKHTQYDIMVTGSAVNFEETNFDSLIWPYLFMFSAEVPRPLFPGWRDVMAVCVLHGAAHRAWNFPKTLWFLGSSSCPVPCRPRPDPSLSGSFWNYGGFMARLLCPGIAAASASRPGFVDMERARAWVRAAS